MPSLPAQQLLLKLAQLSQKEEGKISREEIRKKINKIKYLASQKRVPQSALKKEIINLEKRLQNVFALEKDIKTKEERSARQINFFKKQVAELKEHLAHAKDLSLRRKINKISFLLGELIARSEIKKEVSVQEALQKLIKKKPLLSPDLLFQRINGLKEKISALKASGQYPLEKITALEERLAKLESQLEISQVVEPEKPQLVKHEILFGPEAEEKPPQKEIEGIPLPPPPVRKRL